MGMYYSEDFVEEVRQRNDIVDIISSYVNLKRSGSNYVGLCPFHNEKTASFSVSGNKQMYYCFGCGAGGNVFTFLMEYENLTFPEALAQLAERAGMELPEQSDRRKTTTQCQRTNFRDIQDRGKLLLCEIKLGARQRGQTVSARTRVVRRDDPPFWIGIF